MLFRGMTLMPRLALSALLIVMVGACSVARSPVASIQRGLGGKLELVEIHDHTWPEIFDLIRRESGLTIHVPVLPSGRVSLRLENCESWEHVLAVMAESKGYAIEQNGPGSLTLLPK